MASHNKWDQIKKSICCCACRNTSSEDRFYEHKYCGCKESRDKKKRIMSSDVATRSLVDNEVFEAIDYDFQPEDFGECLDKASTPFYHVLRSPLRPQSDIIIQGTILDDAIRFSINLIAAHDSTEDVAFYFSPRLDQQYSARNSYVGDKWGREEGVSQTKFPFRRGQPFFVEIFLTHSAFLVAVNGMHHCSYTYRTYLIDISSLQIFGGVSLSRVQVAVSDVYPNCAPANFSPNPHVLPLCFPGITKYELQESPVYGLLNSRLKENCKIVINGRLKLLPISFYISLQEGSKLWPHPEVPLQLSMRFNQKGVKQMVLMNSYSNSWDKEEQLALARFILIPGSEFKVVIVCKEDAFEVSIGDEIKSTFIPKVPYSLVDTVHIQGDVFIYDIGLFL